MTANDEDVLPDALNTVQYNGTVPNRVFVCRKSRKALLTSVMGKQESWRLDTNNDSTTGIFLALLFYVRTRRLFDIN